MYRRHYLENWCWATPPRIPHSPNIADLTACLEFEPFEIFPNDAWARMEGEQLEVFRKRSVAAYRKGGEGGLLLRPPLAVAIEGGQGAAAAVPVELANLRLDISVSSSSVVPLFLPVFILEFSRFGANFRVFVCGSSGRVGGERHFSALKAYLLSGSVVTAVLSSLPLNLLHVFAASGTVGAMAACALPLLKRHIKTLERAHVIKRLRARVDSRNMRQHISATYKDPLTPIIDIPSPLRLIVDDLILRLLPLSFRKRILTSSSLSQHALADRYDRSSQAHLKHLSASSQALQLDPELLPPPGFNDPLGYYAVLGLQSFAVTPDAIGDAMRRQARRYHPDLVPHGASEDEAQAAAEAFRRVVTAYQVLRDGRRRREYHLMQPSLPLPEAVDPRNT